MLGVRGRCCCAVRGRRGLQTTTTAVRRECDRSVEQTKRGRDGRFAGDGLHADMGEGHDGDSETVDDLHDAERWIGKRNRNRNAATAGE